MRHKFFRTIEVEGAPLYHEIVHRTLRAAREHAAAYTAANPGLEGRCHVLTMDGHTDEVWQDGKRHHHYTPSRRYMAG